MTRRVRSGYGASLYLEELRKALKVETRYADRLTRQEALGLLELPQRAAAAGHPELAEALRDKNNPNHALYSAYRDVARYFAEEHQQDGTGEPIPWPDRGGRREASADQPFGHLSPDEARELLEFARDAWPEYQTVARDKSHPLHAVTMERTLLAIEVAGADEGDAPPVSQAPAAQQNAAQGRAADQEIAAARADPAYFDASHPDHAKAVARVQAAYEARYPAPARAPAAGGGSAPQSTPARSPAEITAEFAKDAAWSDASHPGHAAALERASAAFATAFPEARLASE